MTCTAPTAEHAQRPNRYLHPQDTGPNGALAYFAYIRKKGASSDKDSALIYGISGKLSQVFPRKVFLAKETDVVVIL